MSQTVIALIPDLFFGVRVQDVVSQLGGEPHLVMSAEDLSRAWQEPAALVLIDLSAGDDWAQVVKAARQDPERAATLVIAFGSHVDAAALQRARQAGCDHAWARSRFVQALPGLIKDALQHEAAR